MIFDINMENFRRNTILVACVHVTKPPATIKYEIVVSRETFCTALTVVALNDFQVKTV